MCLRPSSSSSLLLLLLLIWRTSWFTRVEVCKGSGGDDTGLEEVPATPNACFTRYYSCSYDIERVMAKVKERGK